MANVDNTSEAVIESKHGLAKDILEKLGSNRTLFSVKKFLEAQTKLVDVWKNQIKTAS